MVEASFALWRPWGAFSWGRSRPSRRAPSPAGGKGGPGIRGASRTMHHGCTPRGASRYISHRERAPTAGAKLSLCHKVSRKRGCSRGGTVPRGERWGRGWRRRTILRWGSYCPGTREKEEQRGRGGRRTEKAEGERADIQIYGNVRPLGTGLSIWSSLLVVIPIINITIVAVFASSSSGPSRGRARRA